MTRFQREHHNSQPPPRNHRSITIAKNQNTFAKRSREMEKRRKADDKRQDRQKRKDLASLPGAAPSVPVIEHPDREP
jgi:hypothetical protein